MAKFNSTAAIIYNSTASTNANYGVREYKASKTITGATNMTFLTFTIASAPASQLSFALQIWQIGSYNPATVQYNTQYYFGNYYIQTSSIWAPAVDSTQIQKGDFITSFGIGYSGANLTINPSANFSTSDLAIRVRAFCADWSKVTATYN